MARRAVEFGPSDADGLLFLANALFESGEIAEAMETAERAVALNPLRPPYYYLFNAMILWGNERYQEALEEAEACLRMAPNFAGADTYRAMALVGLGRLEEAKAQLTQMHGQTWRNCHRHSPSARACQARIVRRCRPPVGAPP